jgi:hypothetical protein
MESALKWLFLTEINFKKSLVVIMVHNLIITDLIILKMGKIYAVGIVFMIYKCVNRAQIIIVAIIWNNFAVVVCTIYVN